MSADDYIRQCRIVLRRAGGRVTRPRLAVMHCLAEAQESLSPKDILKAIADKHDVANIDLVSVYRILDAFLKLDLVHQIHPSGGYIACTHIGCTAEIHILGHCTVCKDTEEIDIPAELLASLQRLLQEKSRFTTNENIIQVNGICDRCSKKALGRG